MSSLLNNAISGGYQRYKLGWENTQSEVALTYSVLPRAVEYFNLLEAHAFSLANREESLTYIYQAKSFWDAAEHGNISSAPLTYYYCFLNLAKALFSSKSDSTDQRQHGVRDMMPQDGSLSIVNSDSFENAVLELHLNVEKNVFPVLAKYMHADEFPFDGKIKVKVIDLLSLVGEVGQQAELILKTRYCRRIFGGFNAFVFTQSPQVEAKLILAIEGAAKAANDLPQGMKKISSLDLQDRSLIRNWFKIDAWVKDRYDYFVSAPINIPTQSGLWNLLHTTLNRRFQPVLFDEDYDFMYVKRTPIINNDGKEADIYLNEALAIYLIMFYMGSTVRYKPSKLIDSDPQNILLRQFVQTAPIIFLAHLSSVFFPNCQAIRQL